MTNMQEMLGSMGEGEEGIATNVDIVFVIDATRSMRTTIDMVKESALSFQDKRNALRVMLHCQRFVPDLDVFGLFLQL